MLETNANDFVAAGSLGRRGRVLLAALLCASGAACIGLGGCASTQPALEASLSPDFGAATAANRNAQFVAPDAAQKANTFIRPNAARQRLAIETYEAGEVEIDSAATE